MHVMGEVDALTKEHTDMDLASFNDDTIYKDLTAQAIDSKLMAITKIQLFVDSVPQSMEDKTLLDRITARNFMDFSHESTMLELQTGASGFPWEQVMGWQIDRCVLLCLKGKMLAGNKEYGVHRLWNVDTDGSFAPQGRGYDWCDG